MAGVTLRGLRGLGYSSIKDVTEGITLHLKDRLGMLKPERYFSQVMEYTKLSADECLKRAMNKQAHKETWEQKDRTSESEYRDFYQESGFYIFRQPWRYRARTWHVLGKLIPSGGRMADYGCGAAAMVEWLSRRYPENQYVVADVPSQSLEFVRFRFRNRPNVEVLSIGQGREGLPLKGTFDLITCCEVMEHTFNPDEICEHFVEHLAPGGHLYLDFQNDDWEGENLKESAKKRPQALDILKSRLQPVKAIDDNGTWWGLYRKTR